MEEGYFLAAVAGSDNACVAPPTLFGRAYAVIVGCTLFKVCQCYNVTVNGKFILNKACNTDVNAREGACNSF